MSYRTTLRELIGNPALEALELRDFGAADCAPTLDADAFDPDDYPSDDDFARMEAENERFKRDAATVFGGSGDDDTDPTPPAAGAWPADALTYPASAARFGDDELITAVVIGDEDPRYLQLDPVRREAWLAAMTAEVLRRLAA
jgi:hypothetical protein